MADGVVIPAGQADPDTGADGTEVKTDPKGADAAKTEPLATTPASVAPENYDLKVPDGALLLKADIDRLTTEAKEMGLTGEEAQEYLDTNLKAVTSYHDAQMKQVEEIRTSWIKEAEADIEIGGTGGAAFKGNVELAKRVIDRVGSPAFKKALDDTGFGNHPEVIRTFVRLGKMMGDDKLVTSKTVNTGNRTPAEILYPSKQTLSGG